MNDKTLKAIEHVQANIEVIKSDSATELEKGVALEQLKHNAASAHAYFAENH